MNRKHPFEDRMLTHILTPEFVEYGAGIEDDDLARETIELAARRFERSYNAVVGVSEKDRFNGWTVRVIHAQDADPDAIRRGIQELVHWIDHPPEDA